MWVQVVRVSRGRVTMKVDGVEVEARWPGPLPHVGAIRVIGVSTDEVLQLGRNAVLADRPGDAHPEGAVLLTLTERGDGHGRFEIDGYAVELRIDPTAADGSPADWRVGTPYRARLDALTAWDRLIA